jgi:hypothetical protein
MISFGVPFGAKIPTQFENENPASPASSAVGISCTAGNRCLAATAMGLTLPDRTAGTMLGSPNKRSI